MTIINITVQVWLSEFIHNLYTFQLFEKVISFESQQKKSQQIPYQLKKKL